MREAIMAGTGPHAAIGVRSQPDSAARRPPRRFGIAVPLLGLLLSACASSSAPEAPPPCPTALFLKGAERTAAYLPGTTPRPADLQHLAVMTNLVSACSYGDGNLDVALRFDLIGEKGPAYGGGPLPLTFFVATIGPDQQVLNKQLFDATVEFPEAQQLGGSAQELTVRLPSVERDAGQQYAVYLGFQLDDAEIQRRLDSMRQ
jgi:hypothetical protein